MSWYVQFDASPQDITTIMDRFGNSGFLFEEIDGRIAINAPVFNSCKDKHEVISAGMELATAINYSLRLTLPQYQGLMFWGVVERREDGTTSSAAAMVRGVMAEGQAGEVGARRRSKEERLLSVFERRHEVIDLAVGLTANPLTWGAMSKTYESVVGLMSDKPNPTARRRDWANLVARGWLTAEQSNSFYHTASYHRHGYPKIPSRGAREMDYFEAKILVSRLFWRLVDEWEPS